MAPTGDAETDPYLPPSLARIFPCASLLGQGGESMVFALDDDRILRVPRANGLHDWQNLAGTYAVLAESTLPFATPVIHEVGESGGQIYSVEARLRGEPLRRRLADLSGDAREQALLLYFEAVTALGSVDTSALPRAFDARYGELYAEHPVAADDWPSFLVARLDAARERTEPRVRDRVQRDLPDLDAFLRDFANDVKPFGDPIPALVHGDWFPGNVLTGSDDRVTAVIDFGPMTHIGDGRMDAVGAVVFLESSPGRPEDVAFLEGVAATSVADWPVVYSAYRRFYAVAYLFPAAAAPHGDRLYQWCLRVVRGFRPLRQSPT